MKTIVQRIPRSRMSTVHAVILAAGLSSRLGFNKLTVTIDAETVIRRAVAPFVEAGLGNIVVVTGRDEDRLRHCLEGLAVRFVHNKDYRTGGMSSSVRSALPFIGDAEAVFFHLGDKPFVDPQLLQNMILRYDESNRGMVVPACNGVKGHPVLMRHKPYRQDMENLEGDKGLREVIEKHATDVVFIEGDEGILFDIDTPEDVEILRERGHTVEKG